MSGKVSKMISQKQKTPQTTIDSIIIAVSEVSREVECRIYGVGSKTAFLEEEVQELRIEAHKVLVQKTQKGELIPRSRKMFKAKP